MDPPPPPSSPSVCPHWFPISRASFQVLTVANLDGEITSFLATLPVIHGAHMTRVAYLSSLQEVSVVDVASNHQHNIQIETEPAFIGVGPNHVAVGMNNQVPCHPLPLD